MKRLTENEHDELIVYMEEFLSIWLEDQKWGKHKYVKVMSYIYSDLLLIDKEEFENSVKN